MDRLLLTHFFQVKEVSKYSDDLHKTHKQVKDDESSTSDSVKVLQVSIHRFFVQFMI